MIWNRDAVMAGLGRFENDVAADLMHPCILPATAQDFREMPT
jgi:hypothetical protein